MKKNGRIMFVLSMPIFWEFCAFRTIHNWCNQQHSLCKVGNKKSCTSCNKTLYISIGTWIVFDLISLQAKIEARLKRMHEREEATRKLVCSVDLLLQQQSLRAGQINPNEVSRMSQREVLKTTNDVVKEFNEMRRQLLNMDLRVDEGRQQTDQMPETKWQKALKSSKMPKNPTAKSKPSTVIKSLSSDISPAGACTQKQQGVAFEIPVNDSGSSKKCKKKPAIASLQTKELKRDNQEMVALKVEEKHRKAAERRQVCIHHILF